MYKIAGAILVALLVLGGCGISVKSSGGTSRSDAKEVSEGSVESTASENEAGENQVGVRDMDVDITFDFESKTVSLNSGYEMPINGLGTYSLHGDECINSVKTALENGVRLIDTASAYGNEEEIGQAIREAIEEGMIMREDIFVTTKIYPGSEMENPEESIQACLERLDMQYR